IEFKSRITGALFKESYEKYIKPHDISAPDGYLWKMMYVEVLVYCFSSKTTGGYLRPIIYQKPRPTVEEMKGGFWKLVKGNKHSTNDIINWVSLNILPDIESYIAEGRKIDHQIVDKISKVFLDFYLTPSNK
ncbi:MAG TPA: hypothetical protein PK265_01080, partial [Candidatus Saccharibacteria bacterium]|nr:hypothetical protein [Candidatus Saccharibacteria bacterium]